MSTALIRAALTVTGGAGLVFAGIRAGHAESKRDVEAARQRAATAKANAAAKKSEADAEAAKAQAEASKASAAAAAASAELEKRKLEGQLDRERREKQAEADKASAAAAAAQNTRDIIAGVPVRAAIGAGIGTAAGVVAALIARRAGAGAVQQLNTLGRTVQSALTKAGNAPIVGTPRADAVRAAVNAAKDIGGKQPFRAVGQPPKAVDGLMYAVSAEGAVSLTSSFFVKDEQTAAMMRTTGIVSMFAGLGGKTALVMSRTFASRVDAKAMHALATGAERLGRETRQAKAYLNPRGGGTPPVAPAPRNAPAPPARSSGGSFERTYKKGPKAGTTEIVRKG